jgi:hypothetical protein
MGAIAIFLFKLGSRNRLNNKRREKPFVANYEQTFGVRLPQQGSNRDAKGTLQGNNPQYLGKSTGLYAYGTIQKLR